LPDFFFFFFVLCFFFLERFSSPELDARRFLLFREGFQISKMSIADPRPFMSVCGACNTPFFAAFPLLLLSVIALLIATDPLFVVLQPIHRGGYIRRHGCLDATLFQTCFRKKKTPIVNFEKHRKAAGGTSVYGNSKTNRCRA
jgi:hypothetical protein